MTLDDLERQNRGFIDLAILGCDTHFIIMPNSLQVGQDNLCMKFFNIERSFDWFKVSFFSLQISLHSRNLPYGGIKLRYPLQNACSWPLERHQSYETVDAI